MSLENQPKTLAQNLSQENKLNKFRKQRKQLTLEKESIPSPSEYILQNESPQVPDKKQKNDQRRRYLLEQLSKILDKTESGSINVELNQEAQEMRTALEQESLTAADLFQIERSINQIQETLGGATSAPKKESPIKQLATNLLSKKLQIKSRLERELKEISDEIAVITHSAITVDHTFTQNNLNHYQDSTKNTTQAQMTRASSISPTTFNDTSVHISRNQSRFFASKVRPQMLISNENYRLNQSYETYSALKDVQILPRRSVVQQSAVKAGNNFVPLNLEAQRQYDGISNFSNLFKRDTVNVSHLINPIPSKINLPDQNDRFRHIEKSKNFSKMLHQLNQQRRVSIRQDQSYQQVSPQFTRMAKISASPDQQYSQNNALSLPAVPMTQVSRSHKGNLNSKSLQKIGGTVEERHTYLHKQEQQTGPPKKYVNYLRQQTNTRKHYKLNQLLQIDKELQEKLWKAYTSENHLISPQIPQSYSAQDHHQFKIHPVMNSYEDDHRNPLVQMVIQEDGLDGGKEEYEAVRQIKQKLRVIQDL
ncbi:hypothetical protein FGO68_gene1536 [Halteria grandinella]|uniref:Uncharacterized protein n=1 Tax=Halteria grandinella TaxID=5974 RepID=A0A8J8NGJ7_HALGN|nr:hypothetical protein FGO68_gene1536 [Halteria grandinella]